MFAERKANWRRARILKNQRQCRWMRSNQLPEGVRGPGLGAGPTLFGSECSVVTASEAAGYLPEECVLVVGHSRAWMLGRPANQIIVLGMNAQEHRLSPLSRGAWQTVVRFLSPAPIAGRQARLSPQLRCGAGAGIQQLFERELGIAQIHAALASQTPSRCGSAAMRIPREFAQGMNHRGWGRSSKHTASR